MNPSDREEMETLAAQNEELTEKLREAEEIISAIRQGRVDALVINSPQGEQVYTLKGADYAFRVLIEAMNEGAVTLTAGGMVLYCNSRFAEMLRSPLEKVIGASILDHIPRQERPGFEELLLKGRSGGVRREFRLRLPGGSHLPVQVSLTPLKMEEISAICMIATDLTRTKQKEEQLSAYAALLEESNRSLQDFAFIASHDLQEPLRKVQAFGDLLASRYAGSLGKGGLDYVERMQGAAMRMQELIKALLSYSRVTTQVHSFKTVDLNHVVQEALSNLESRLKSSRGEVRIENLPAVEADPTQMVQLFQNLISNALKFHREDHPPLVRIFSERTGAPDKEGGPSGPPCQCSILVEDNGIGIDPQFLSTIFKPFQRLHGRSQFEGTGMGLSICRKIVERHGGSITARSSNSRGATFIVTLPATQEGKGATGAGASEHR